MTGPHSLGMEAVAQVRPDGQRVEAGGVVDEPVERAEDALPVADPTSRELRSLLDSEPVELAHPGLEVVRSSTGTTASRSPSRSWRPSAMPHSRKTRWAADRGGRARAASRSSSRDGAGAHRRLDPLGQRRAVEAMVAQSLRRRAAGGPALHAEDVEPDRSESSRRSVSPSPPTGAWSSTTNTVSKPDVSSVSHGVSTRFSQGWSTTCTDVPRAASCSAALSASCSMTGPYASSSASVPSRRTVPRPGETA